MKRQLPLCAMQNQSFYEWRKYLINLLHEIIERENMHISIYWLATSLFDRFALKYEMKKEDIQFIGITILMIASKVEDIYTMSYSYMSRSVSKTYSTSDFIHMEMIISKTLLFQLVDINTAYYCLKKYISLCATMEEESKIHMAFFFAESNLKEEISAYCSPSLFAAAAIFLALMDQSSYQIKYIWTEEHVRVTSFTKENVFPIAHILLKNLKKTNFYEGNALHSVEKKYRRPEFMYVSTLPLPDLEEIVSSLDITVGCPKCFHFL